MPAPKGPRELTLVDQLNALAPAKPVNVLLGVDKYYTSAELLLRQASLYRSSNNEEQLYVMLMRFASLAIETIPKHKDFSKQDAKYVQLRKALAEKVLPELETIKISLRTKELPEPVAKSANRPPDIVRLTSSNLPQLDWARAAPLPAPQVNVDDLLDILSGASSTGGQQHQQQQQQQQHLQLQQQGCVGSSSLPEYQPNSKYASRSRDGVEKHTLYYNNRQQSLGTPYQYTSPAGAALPYPSLDLLGSPSSTSQPGSSQSLPIAQQMLQMQLGPTAGPPLGPQEVQVFSISPELHGAPGSCSDPCPSAPGPPPPELSSPEPPSSASAASGGPRELAKRAQLRDVHVSVALMEQFLHFASANSSRGIESCGILAGHLSANDSTFTISTLIIPKQKGTSDTVEMLSEEDVLQVHLEKELYPLGWIHTHPTQTCFLSSVDVHTQCSYQTMLDEAVAIVMAPKDQGKKCGIFRLTTPGGLTLVQKCDRRGFHMHPDTSTRQELYELCGHVYLNDRVKHEVVDLR